MSLPAGTYCNLFMCSPTSTSTIAMDGVTQLPVDVWYTIWTEDGAGTWTQLDSQDNYSVSLVNYQKVTWNGTSYPEGANLNDSTMRGLGWTYTPFPGNDIIKGASDGCASLPVKAPYDTLTYIKRTFYLSHYYGTQADVDNNPDSKIFTIAAQIFLNAGSPSWNTTAKALDAQKPQNTDDTTLPVTVADGTPIFIYFANFINGMNTIIANGNMTVGIEVDLQITSPSDGSTGQPLSSQSQATCKLISYTTGDDLDGYNGGRDGYGNWNVANSGIDSSISSTPGNATCLGCGVKPLQGKKKSYIYYVSHSPSFIKTQSVAVGLSASYTPPGAKAPIVWTTAFDQPISCCMSVTALSENQTAELEPSGT